MNPAKEDPDHRLTRQLHLLDRARRGVLLPEEASVFESLIRLQHQELNAGTRSLSRRLGPEPRKRRAPQAARP